MARSTLGWMLAAPLLLIVLLLVAVPGLVDPVLDPALRIGGLPGMPIAMGTVWLAATAAALAWRSLLRRSSPGLAEAVAMVAVTAALLLIPSVVLLVKSLSS